MTEERQPNTELREKARQWVNEKYPDGDFAQFNDPIQELVGDLVAFAASIQEEARQQIEELEKEVERLKGEVVRERKIGDNCRLDASRNGERALELEKQLAEARAQAQEQANIISGACQILDVIKIEWGVAWSDWDQSIRDGLSKISAAMRRE